MLCIAAGVWLGWSIRPVPPEPGPVLLWHAVEVPTPVVVSAPAPDPMPQLNRVEQMIRMHVLDPATRFEFSDLPK